MKIIALTFCASKNTFALYLWRDKKKKVRTTKTSTKYMAKPTTNLPFILLHLEFTLPYVFDFLYPTPTVTMHVHESRADVYNIQKDLR